MFGFGLGRRDMFHHIYAAFRKVLFHPLVVEHSAPFGLLGVDLTVSECRLQLFEFPSCPHRFSMYEPSCHNAQESTCPSGEMLEHT